MNKIVENVSVPLIQGSPTTDYRENHASLSAKNAHTDPLADVSHVIGQSYTINDYRVHGLKLAYDALTPRIFGIKQPKLNDLEELYELAEYNVRFILNKEINLQCMSQDEKLRKVIDKYK